jgi:hypothetical protein
MSNKPSFVGYFPLIMVVNLGLAFELLPCQATIHGSSIGTASTATI